MKNLWLSRSLSTIGVLVLCILPRAVYGAAATNTDMHYDPVANPRAVVIIGSARFTILTPQLIRMEWASDRKFEDRPSLVFLNRRLSVPEFTQDDAADGSAVIRTTALTLTYAPGKSDGKF